MLLSRKKNSFFPVMNSFRSFLLLFSSLLSCVAAAGSVVNILPESPSSVRLRLPGDRNIHMDNGLFCESWRYVVETNDAGDWEEIPERCVGFVEAYMEGCRYTSDSKAVARSSLGHARGVKIAGDGKDAWIFDIDETLLSNLPFFISIGFGAEALNGTAFAEWVESAKAPALPASFSLYQELQKLGFRLILLTGRREYQRNATIENLLDAGYSSWDRLILRGASDDDKSALVYKSGKRKELEEEGYRIHGSSGDQWSDLLGFPMAARSFKLPNPMYYIA